MCYNTRNRKLRRKMAQHYLLSSSSKTFSLEHIAEMSDEEVYELFKKIRWNKNNGNPICPKCGNTQKVYTLKTKRFRCGKSRCKHTFSITSGTIFHSRKMKLKKYLYIIFLFVCASKSISALQITKNLKMSYKSAWVRLQKIRSTLEEHNWDEKFSGVCQIDGVYVNHYVRPANKLKNRVDRRKVYKPNKRVIISIRSLPYLQNKGIGSQKTKVFVLKSENAKEIREIVYKHVWFGSEIHADENIAYDDLIGVYNLKRVNHRIEYMGDNGENNNQCESFNARMRRSVKGQFHKISTLYLSLYANEIAYREDNRRKSTGEIFYDLLDKGLKSEPNSELTGYWQGNKRIAERLAA